MTTDVLTRQEYQAIEGTYRLGKLLAGSSDSAVYETEYGEGRKPAWIELRRGDSPDAKSRLSLWREAVEFSHPNLIRLYAAGSSTLDGVGVIYLVMERADDSLAGVLAERTLTEEETREMLEPILSALRYLHKKGYAHGSLEPLNILAIGDRLKLSSDGVQRIHPNSSTADDMWAFGLVLVQALTGEVPKPGRDAAPYVLGEAPEPIRGIVRHSLDPDAGRRWTAEQALEYLRFPNEPRPTAMTGESIAVVEPKRRSRPDADVHAEDDSAMRRGTRDYRKWIYGPLAGLLLIAAVVGLSKRADRAPVGTPPASEASSAPAPIAPRRAETIQTPQSGKTPEARRSPVAPPPAAASRAPQSRDRKADGWAVVVAAYGARGPAEKRTREMAKRWPRFKVDLFEPASEKARHLVVIGTNLSEENAKALRARAVSAGLPRDAYIKRFATSAE